MVEQLGSYLANINVVFIYHSVLQDIFQIDQIFKYKIYINKDSK